MTIPNKWVALATSWSDNMDGTESMPYCKVGHSVHCAAAPKLHQCMQCKSVHVERRAKKHGQKHIVPTAKPRVKEVTWLNHLNIFNRKG